MQSKEYEDFKSAVNKNFKEMSEGELFRVDTPPDAVWELYLKSFPPGTNEIYLVRTHHDCSTCRNFIKNIGNAVTLKNGVLRTVFDVEGQAEPYQTVANKLREYIISRPIRTVFRAKERNFGSLVTPALLRVLRGGEIQETNEAIQWRHFHGAVSNRHLSNTPDAACGTINSTVGVFKKGMTKITADAINHVKSLITSKVLYRGEENKSLLEAFGVLHAKYAALDSETAKDRFCWENYHIHACRLANSALGEFLINLSSGMDNETALRKYEAMVAPGNYKRPVAAITPAMVKRAEETLEELGLLPALSRRLAKVSDVSVKDVLFVDNRVQGLMKGGLAGIIGGVGMKPQKVDYSKATRVSLDDFLSGVLKGASSVGVVVRPDQENNLVSLTAPVEGDTGKLFKWDNDFAWSYNGNVADSIKERVKKAGGNVTNAKLRVSLSWSNWDDLDLYCKTPSGNTISYSYKQGILDVDMNAGGRTSGPRDPVENMSWSKAPTDGVYQFSVHQYRSMEGKDTGFELEVEHAGVLQRYSYPHPQRSKEMVDCLEITMKGGVVQSIKMINKKLVEGAAQGKETWGIRLGELVPVTFACLSPNHWGENSVGAKHLFFSLKDCKAEGEVRGFYNEFLRGVLDPHRKVFEILGDRMKCPPSDEQVSGVGFSQGRGDTAIVSVDNRLYEVLF